MKYLHKPILLYEIINLLEIDKKPLDKIIVDCTLGLGGHSKEFLQKNPKLKIIAIDQDQDAMNIAKNNLKNFSNINYHHCNFSEIENVLTNQKVDGFLIDLGVSSMHFDNPNRGFSYRYDGPLDMRMDQNNNNLITAKEIVNNYTKEKIIEILKIYGEENFAKLIANQICNSRQNNPINTTLELDKIIKSAIPKKFLFKQKYPSKKTFQALRIFINNELDVLLITLQKIIKYLNVNGIIAILTFHSLEDRIVKNFFNELIKTQEPLGIFTREDQKIYSDFKLITKKPIVASKLEIVNNPRAKSAKLRVIKKVR